jgi:cysteine sulfinate desulfinase/cysteine desulfurase-like protein
MATAAELGCIHLPDYDEKVRPLRNELEEGILGTVPNTELDGHRTGRVGSKKSVIFHRLKYEVFLNLRLGG